MHRSRLYCATHSPDDRQQANARAQAPTTASEAPLLRVACSPLLGGVSTNAQLLKNFVRPHEER